MNNGMVVRLVVECDGRVITSGSFSVDDICHQIRKIAEEDIHAPLSVTVKQDKENRNPRPHGFYIGVG